MVLADRHPSVISYLMASPLSHLYYLLLCSAISCGHAASLLKVPLVNAELLMHVPAFLAA